MVQIATKAYGPLAIEERQIIEFPEGLYGFTHLHAFALIDSTQPPFYWLQSTEESATAFIVVNPYLVTDEYVLDVSESDLIALESPDADDLLVFVIVTVASGSDGPTCNFQGPVLINRRRRTGRQAISLVPDHHTRHPLAPATGRA